MPVTYYRNSDLGRLRRLWEGADSGLFALPEPWVRLRRALQVLEGSAVPEHNGNETDVARALVKAAGDGGVPDDWDREFGLTPSAEAGVRYNAIVATRNLALASASDMLVGSVHALADEFLSGPLSVALAEIVEAMAPYAETIETLPYGVPLSVVAKEQRQAVTLADTAVARYAAIRTAQGTLQLFRGTPSTDAHRWFGEFRGGLRAVWPTRGTQFEREAPWPGTAHGRLGWLVANYADELWVPDADECEAAYNEFVRASPKLQHAPVG